MNKNDTLQHATLLNQRPEQVRRLLPRGLRRLIAFVLLLLLLLSLIVTAAAFRPFALTLPTPLFFYSQTIQPDYTVNLTANAQLGTPTLPAGRLYVRDYTESVTVRFDIAQRALSLGSLTSRAQAEAVLQVYSAQNPTVLLMERKNPLPVPEITIPTFAGQDLSRSVTVPLAVYRDLAGVFLKESSTGGSAFLTVRLTLEMVGSRYGQGASHQQIAEVAIPLSLETFPITITPAKTRQLVSRPIRYLVEPETLPLFAYPLISSVLLLLLVLFLSLTANRPVRHFQRELKRLLRQGRSQILMIADKAWEPEWCVTVASFGSMVRTARRMRHPIFCYVDNDPEHPAAYFYVYYGENNYCYIHDGLSIPAASLQPMRGIAAPVGPSALPSNSANASAGVSANVSAGAGLGAGAFGHSGADELPTPVLNRNAAAESARGAVSIATGPFTPVTPGSVSATGPFTPLAPASASAASAASAAGSSTATGFTAPAGAAATAPAAKVGDNRFHTGPFRYDSITTGVAQNPPAPTTFGPTMPSPEPFLDLIHDSWPGSQEQPDQPDSTDRPDQPDRADRLDQRERADRPAYSRPSDTADRADRLDQRQTAASAGNGSGKESEHTPLPILPETDASFSLF